MTPLFETPPVESKQTGRWLMPNVYVLFWFDVEDCTVPQSDDATKRLALILGKHNVRGTFKVVGQKARLLEQRMRFDVIDVLRQHDIGFHSNWHGLRPQIGEYLGPLDWEQGVAEFEKREGPGLEDVRRLFGPDTTTYGQPGSNWAPHVFPVLRKWNIPTYVSGYGYVGVDCQPFWYGGVLCTSHMYGKRLSGEEESHLMGLNFELGQPGELEKHQETFRRSLERLSASGGLISILNHPCTLVLEEWFSTYMKPRELTEAGYTHFEEFVKWVVAHPNVKTTCASELPTLYPDRALGRWFSRDELAEMAANLSEEINFQRLGEVTLSAAEALGLLVAYLLTFIEGDELSPGVFHRPLYHPTSRPEGLAHNLTVSWAEFCDVTRSVARSLEEKREAPGCVVFAKGAVAPEHYLGAVAHVLAKLLAGESAPDTVTLVPKVCRFEDFVDEEGARSGWASVMLPARFAAPKMIELARLEAWTLKPAVLRAGA